MAFIGKEPLTGAYNMLDSLTASATASYSLTLDSVAFVPESANHLLVSLNGSIQKAGSSYTVSGSTLTFSSTLASSDSIDFVLALGNVLDIGTPSDSTVTNAKTNFVSTSSAAGLQIKGDGTTDGTLQLNCSQNSHGIKLKSPAHSTSSSYTLTFPGTDPSADKFLKTDGSGNLSFADAGGGLVPIAQSQSTSGTGAVNFDGCFTTTYKNYFIVISQFVAANTSADMIMRFRDSSSATLTSSNYAYGGQVYKNSDASELNNYGDNGANFQLTHSMTNDANKIGATFAMHVMKPYDSNYTRFNANYGYVHNSGFLYSGSIGGAYQDSTSVRGIRFECSTGNTEAHDVRIYGIVDS